MSAAPDGWGPAPASGNDNPIRLLIIGQPGRAQALYTAFAADARFAVQAIATGGPDAKAKLTLDPEAVIAELAVFTSAPEVNDLFAAYRGLVWALLPASITPQQAAAVRQIPCVVAGLEGDPNLASLAGDINAAILARRPVSGGSAAEPFNPLRANTTMIGWRAIAVWSPQGGVGKSTVALALALEATQRRLPTLLVGLGAPDGIPLILDGVAPDPNILNWRANATVEGLKAAVQVHKRTGQHILVGFRDPLAVSMLDKSGPAGLTNLAYTVAQAGYGILVLDVSTQELAPAALSAANTLVMVGRADLPGIRSVLEGVHLVQDVMAGQHAIPDGAVHLVLNRVRDTTLRPDAVVAFGKRERREFPPLAAVVADDPNVEVAINRMEPAYYGSESLRRAAKTLGDLLFPAALAAAPSAGQPAKVVKIGPLRVRL